MSRIGITDEANKAEDTLNIKKHALALTKFISETATPMTIGIQGEWGSGKTSLLNQIHSGLETGGYKQIWINAWEHSLSSSAEQALLKIIQEIITEFVGGDKALSKRKDLSDKLNTFVKGAAKIGASVIGGNAAADATTELFSNKNTIRELRTELRKVSEDIVGASSNEISKAVIYVDDLDRIEPKDAVKILELLKNVFDVPNCVFVLAIDYQVVVKGLKEKFGDPEKNEWEFRAFFDKIIQLPFMMPMSQYDIGNYVLDLLGKIEYIEDSHDNTIQDEITELVQHSIGGNPRSLKRLINSLTLIDIFSKLSDEDQDEDENLDETSIESDGDKIILLALVCLQISYPVFHELLSESPDFTLWKEGKEASKITKRIEEKNPNFEIDFNFAQENNEKLFDEDWEKVIYRICYSKPRYFAKSEEISKFFNYLRTLLENMKKDDFAEYISQMIEKTSVTSVNSTDSNQSGGIKGVKTKMKSSRKHDLDGIDSTVNSLNNKNKDGEKIRHMHDYLKDKLPKDISIKYKLDCVIYRAPQNSAKKMQNFLQVFLSKDGFQLKLLKHINHLYKIPNNLDKFKFEMLPRSTKWYVVNTDELKLTEIFKLIDESYDMVKNHNDKALSILVRKGDANRFKYKEGGFIQGVDENGEPLSKEKDAHRAQELLDKYLSNNWRYNIDGS